MKCHMKLNRKLYLYLLIVYLSLVQLYLMICILIHTKTKLMIHFELKRRKIFKQRSVMVLITFKPSLSKHIFIKYCCSFCTKGIICSCGIYLIL